MTCDKRLKTLKRRRLHAGKLKADPRYLEIPSFTPSGSLHSPIAHHLHQPSYSTNNLDSDDAETADWTNGCTAMVMGNGFEEGVTFLFDHLHRRSQNSEGYDTYPKSRHPKPREIHAQNWRINRGESGSDIWCKGQRPYLSKDKAESLRFYHFGVHGK